MDELFKNAFMEIEMQKEVAVLDNREMTVCFNDFVLDGEDIFFSSRDFNGLYRANLKTGESNLLGTFPEEDEFGYHLHYGVHKYKDRILFIPAWGNRFVVYDLKNNCFQSILTRKDGVKTKKFRYFANKLVGKYVYAFGCEIPEIIRVDMESLEVKYYEGWKETLCKIGKKEDNPYFFRDICLVDDSLFVVTGQTNAIIELDMFSDQIKIHPVGEKGCIYHTLSYEQGAFLLSGSTGEIVKVDRESWDCTYGTIKDRTLQNQFNSSISVNGETWLFPNKAENILKINHSDFSVTELKIIYDEQDSWYPNYKKYGYGIVKKITGNKIAFFCSEDSEIHICDLSGKETGRVKFYTYDNTEPFYKKNIYHKYSKEHFFWESDRLFYRLEDFLFSILSDESEEMKDNDEHNIGQSIHQFIKNNMI